MVTQWWLIKVGSELRVPSQLTVKTIKFNRKAFSKLPKMKALSLTKLHFSKSRLFVAKISHRNRSFGQCFWHEHFKWHKYMYKMVKYIPARCFSCKILDRIYHKLYLSLLRGTKGHTFKASILI